ncbi:AMP-dependent synthetase [Hymenobacter aquaticus]|uniref:AMP-dependent synthetase n=1 Tax=Hymenobacter aquaticus TaxID=1867101 RepID=A0A4Z0PUL8_9BACT|nr:AMP-binding protein [Hymenobacter aquaticus]TGE21480.1 AMP-dependent synthetase [Hymenobacter aquaticus]
MNSYATLTHYLAHYASTSPAKVVFVYLDEEEANTCSITYAELNERVTELARHLAGRGLGSQRAMLLYAEGLDFIVAFLACLRASVTAVPMFLPRGSKHMARLTTIISDSQSSAILTSGKYLSRIQTGLPELAMPVLATDEPLEAVAFQERAPALDTAANTIAFIQYTSGSTGRPKGVMVSHQNLLHNELLIQQAFGCDEDSIIGSWLPFYHDMGLIGNILHTVFTGGRGVLMSPFYFLQKPQRWLQAISDYRVTHSGGPNFAFDLCVDRVDAAEVSTLDLSCWKVAYNGSEPVRAATLARFRAHFRAAGFQSNAFFPCYGLAEATLLVSGAKTNPEYRTLAVDGDQLPANQLCLLDPAEPSARILVASGRVADGMHVRILDATTQQEAGELKIGEICIAGDSTSAGYWNLDNERIAFRSDDTQRYFKTGDLGFFHQRDLYITGRLKELLIIRGKNYYPYDIEFSAGTAHEAVEKNGVAAFAVEIAGAEELVVLAELKRQHARTADTRPIIKAIEHKVLDETGLRPYDVVLVPPLSIPRTSSGKLQRVQCAQNYHQNYLTALTQARETAVLDTADYLLRLSKAQQEGTAESIQHYLKMVLASKLQHCPADQISGTQELTSLGIDSLRSMEIVNTLNRELSLQLDATQLFQINTVEELAEKIELSLWLNSKQENGKEIIL